MSRKSKDIHHSFEEVMAEMKQILNDLENNTVPIDQLESKLLRAKELKTWCENKLLNIESSIHENME